MLSARQFRSADMPERVRWRIAVKRSILSGGYLVCVVAWLGSLATVGCNPSQSTEEKIETLRVGVLPGEKKEGLETQFSPLVEYLEEELGVSCELVFHDSYEDLQHAFENAEVDLAWLGGYTFVNVNRTCEAVPLVSRDVDLRFTSYFLVRTGETATEIADFRGRRFAFGSRLSTSGHLMPRHSLQDWGIDPDSFFGELHYTGAHDKTAFAVRDGEVDIGVANGVTVDSLFESGQLTDQDVRILKETPPYLNYVWACQVDVPVAFRSKLRDALLNLSTANPSHREILSRLRANHYVPVHSNQFLELRGIVDKLALAETTE